MTVPAGVDRSQTAEDSTGVDDPGLVNPPDPSSGIVACRIFNWMLIFSPSQRLWMISGRELNISEEFSCVENPAIMLINPSKSLQ
jgi:hypothetical protein